MIYKNITTGHFIDRPNRFIAHVEIGGVVETVHVKNTGRCKELLIPGAEVILSKSDNPKRETKYDLIAVYKNDSRPREHRQPSTESCGSGMAGRTSL